MRSIKEILPLILKEFTSCNNRVSELSYPGLCFVGKCLTLQKLLLTEEQNKFNSFLKEGLISQKVLYKASGEETEDRSHFYWKIYEKEPRIKWLEKQIELLT